MTDIFRLSLVLAGGLRQSYGLTGRFIGYQSCRTSRQRLGVNRIDSCNFELCSQGQLCITINSRYSRMGWAAMLNTLLGCHLANA